MPKKITIASFAEAKEVCGKYDWAISISEPDCITNHIACPTTLLMKFWDTRDHETGPKESDFMEALEFVQEFLQSNDQHILIHCWAGISRSTAIGLLVLLEEAGFKPGILEKLGPDKVAEKVNAALRKIYEIRSIAFPNLLFLMHMEKYYGIQGIILGEFEKVNRDIVGRGIYDSGI